MERSYLIADTFEPQLVMEALVPQQKMHTGLRMKYRIKCGLDDEHNNQQQ